MNCSAHEGHPNQSESDISLAEYSQYYIDAVYGRLESTIVVTTDLKNFLLKNSCIWAGELLFQHPTGVGEQRDKSFGICRRKI